MSEERKYKGVVVPPDPGRRKTRKSEYTEFVEKFKPKLTTDDCFTPHAVYDVVVNYVREKCGISEDTTIIRPFYPGGDYENEEYPVGCVVIDNPPFSIVTKIVNFYTDRNIRFFLFAPHLTLFQKGNDHVTRIVADAKIIYENGANVPTSFVSNMFGDVSIMTAPELHSAVKAINDSNKVNLPKYKYPKHVLTVSMMVKWVQNGINYSLNKDEVHFIRSLASQRKFGKEIFGAGYLISDKAASEKLANDIMAANRSAANKIVADKLAEEQKIEWELSPEEKEIIKKLGQ